MLRTTFWKSLCLGTLALITTGLANAQTEREPVKPDPNSTITARGRRFIDENRDGVCDRTPANANQGQGAAARRLRNGTGPNCRGECQRLGNGPGRGFGRGAGQGRGQGFGARARGGSQQGLGNGPGRNAGRGFGRGPGRGRGRGLGR